MQHIPFAPDALSGIQGVYNNLQYSSTPALPVQQLAQRRAPTCIAPTQLGNRLSRRPPHAVGRVAAADAVVASGEVCYGHGRHRPPRQRGGLPLTRTDRAATVPRRYILLFPFSYCFRR